MSISQPPYAPATAAGPYPGGAAGAALRLLAASEPARPLGTPSVRTYTRLLAGEAVSWRQLLREHPLLGSITVAKLVEAGAVRAWPDAGRDGAVDFRLRMTRTG